jgi:hypothetical protein
LSGDARGFYLREMYQAMVREFNSLRAEQYISPHGEKRKQQIISEISEKDHAQLLKAAKSGKISYRQTFLGGCAHTGSPCPLGGISNISSCMGFGGNKACSSVLLDKNKLPMIQALKEVFISQIESSQIDTPYHKSLKASLESAERAINVIEKS